MVEVRRADAFTVDTRKWPGTSTTYRVSNNFFNSGPGWGNRINSIAVPDWNASSVSPFRFWFNSGSINLVEAGSLVNDPSLATTTRWFNGTTYTQFFLKVNTGLNYPFYDGTQAATIPSNYYDLASILRHELGHALGLCHSGGSGTLMKASIGTGTIRGVDTDAQNGGAWIYSTNKPQSPEGSCL